MNIKRRSGLIIPKEFSHEDFYQQILNKLTRRNRQYNSTDFIINTYYQEEDGNLLIPRFFPLEEYVDCNILNSSDAGNRIDLEHNIELRNDLQKNVTKFMLKNSNGIIQAPPGSGKTVMGIYVIVKRARKSLILVHRDSLVDQWKERFFQFTNIKSIDMARLTSTNFQDDLKCPIIITTDQLFTSLLRRNKLPFLDALNKANIGLFLADEVHTSVGAPTFSYCSLYMPSKYVYGLSATPYRFMDGDIINFHLGDIYKPKGSADTMGVKVTVLLLNYGIDIPYRHRYLYWDEQFQRARYLSLMKKSHLFMQTTKGLLKKVIHDSRNIIFVAERIKLIDELFESTKCKSKSKFTGSAKNDTLDFDMTFATPGKVRDGVDAIQKDCLILTSPISNIEQMSGRVVRTAEGKLDPIVIDMVDVGCKDIRNTLHSRLNYYHGKNWNVQFILVNKKGKLNQVSEDVAQQIIVEGVNI